METTTKQGILVMHINVGNLPKNKQKEYLKQTAKTFEELKKSCNIEIIYFLSQVLKTNIRAGL